MQHGPKLVSLLASQPHFVLQFAVPCAVLLSFP
jgi:hypothetical protein